MGRMDGGQGKEDRGQRDGHQANHHTAFFSFGFSLSPCLCR